MDPIDPAIIHEARDFLRRHLAREMKQSFSAVYQANHDWANHGCGPYHFDAQSAGSRSLKNLCLSYRMELLDPEALCLCTEQFRHADNMTDQVSALGTLANADCRERVEALSAFYEQWKAEPLVLDKWLAIQATSRLPGTLAEVRRLTRHPAFNIRNPNKVRSLIGAFCQSNPVRFHDASGAGYAFLADYVLELNGLNPQVAARLLGAMTRWRRYDAVRQALMKAQLERILAAPGLSKDVYEIAAKSLA
jgi:aminopeptidase N